MVWGKIWNRLGGGGGGVRARNNKDIILIIPWVGVVRKVLNDNINTS